MKLQIELSDDHALCVTEKFGSVDALVKKVIVDCVRESKLADSLAKAPSPEAVDESSITLEVTEASKIDFAAAIEAKSVKP